MPSRASIVGLCILLALMFLVASVRCGAQEPVKLELNSTETAMVDQLNAFRARNGLAALKPAAWLMARSRQHCQWMLKNGMIHSSGVAENIAMGQRGVPQVMAAWISSRGHNANMRTSAGFVGVAGYVSSNGTPYWVTQFGGPSGSPVAVEGGAKLGGRAMGFGRRLFGRLRR